MKKIYALVAGLVLAGSVNAQLKGGDFEGIYSPLKAFNAQTGLTLTTNNVGVYFDGQSPAWLGVFTNETTNKITGVQSINMTSVDDAEAANFIQSTPSKVTGLAQQTYEGALADANYANYSFTFKYSYAPVGTDTAFALINILDTTKTGNAQLLAQGLALITSAQATAITKTSTFQASGNPGTANKVTFTLGSSLSNYFDDVPANVGSKFIVDDVQFTTGNVGVENVVATESKVYPNPTTGILNVEISNANASLISIYNLDGSLVKTEALNGMKGSVNVSTLTSGMYIYRIVTDKGEVKATFVKQ